MKKSFNISNRSGFSLMEMMIVLLIVAVVAAATAPMVTKKMSGGLGIGDSPWLFTGDGRSITFNPAGLDDATVIIGAPAYNNVNANGSLTGAEHPRLVIAGGDNVAGLVFADENGQFSSVFDLLGSKVLMGSGAVGANSVAIGHAMQLGGNKNVTALGYNVQTNTEDSVVIGSGAIANKGCDGTNAPVVIGRDAQAGNAADALGATAIGGYSCVLGNYAVALGNQAKSSTEATALGHSARAGVDDKGAAVATKKGQIAIGYNAVATGHYSIAIGTNAQAPGDNSIAIGSSSDTSPVTASEDNQVVLGTESQHVYIPGDLIVGGNVMLGANAQKKVHLREADGARFMYTFSSVVGDDKMKAVKETFKNNSGIDYSTFIKKMGTFSSDRRLKNVGERFTAGLAELNKLDVYNYTFKKDKENTPRVGVMAQDLQKVFPNAVVKGDDGFLRIRMEDMFYAMINAIKELNTRVCEIVKNVTDINAKIDAQQKTIEEQQKTIKELQAQNTEFEKRLTKLENNKCKK